MKEMFLGIKEIINALAKAENLSIETLHTGWQVGLPDLQDASYNALLTSMTPSSEDKERYVFSDPYLNIGDVVVTRINEDIMQLSDLEGKIIAIWPDSLPLIKLEEFPSIVFVKYSKQEEVLQKLIHEEVDGVLMGLIPAYTVCNNLYYGQLKVATDTLDNRSLKFMLFKNEDHEAFVDKINSGLQKIRDDGTYHQLLKKWKLKQ